MDSTHYAELFLTESREHVSAMNHALLALERAGSAAAAREPVSEIFRAVHTVKGMSATMGYTAIADLSHELESLLDRVRRGGLAVTAPLMDLLFRSADMLEGGVEDAVAGRMTPGAGALLDALRAFGREGESPAPVAASQLDRTAAEGAMDTAAPHAAPPRLASGVLAGADGDAPWTVPLPEGEGVAVRVRLLPGTPLRGVRAYLAIEAAGAHGEVTGVSPALDRLQAEAFGEDFALRIRTGDAAVALEALRRAGDVAEVALADEEPRLPVDDESVPDAHATRSPGARPQQHVRIELRRLDALMNLIGELVITRGRLAQIASASDDEALAETVAQASRLVGDLQDEIMQSRMVPVGQVFGRFPRLVRDAAHSVDKRVAFTIAGKDIELDRSMLDEIGDPVMHLLRNAVDHGLESPAERVAAGKPAEGRLTLSAARDRSAVMIRVEDDGRGIDRERVLRKARERGLVEADRSDVPDEELVKLILRPGFSTAERVTGLSGRGVGLDVVVARVRALGGSVDVRSSPGTGTAVTMRLPLTLAIQRSLLARVAAETYALPLTHVAETVELTADALRAVKGREMLVLRDDVLPVLRLRTLVGLPAGAQAESEQVVVIETAERRAALIVDDLTTQQEIVVKQYDAVRGSPGLFSGATILGDGAPALILDVSSLL